MDKIERDFTKEEGISQSSPAIELIYAIVMRTVDKVDELVEGYNEIIERLDRIDKYIIFEDDDE